jgi:hypothetical protein
MPGGDGNGAGGTIGGGLTPPGGGAGCPVGMGVAAGG